MKYYQPSREELSAAGALKQEQASQLPELLHSQKKEVLGQYYHNKKNLIKILNEPSAASKGGKLKLKEAKKNLIAAQLLKQKQKEGGEAAGSMNVDLVAKGHRRTVHFIKRGKYLIDEP